MGDPLLVRQTAKADPLRPALVAPALDMRWEARRFHGIVESLAQFLVVAGGGKSVLNRFVHGPLNLNNHGSLHSNWYGRNWYGRNWSGCNGHGNNRRYGETVACR